MTTDFARRLLDWHSLHGRHDLPWQHPRSAYRVWVAEVMLQQTQVATVIPYYQRFMEAFPDLAALAAAPLDAVLAHWAGLGYYSRARNLHAAAQRCMQNGGELPADAAALAELPGIGRSTAAAILAQAHDQRLAILDGNVRRVLCRMFGIEGWPGEREVERRLWQLSEALLPAPPLAEGRMADYTQAIMDFGATLCRRARPDCPRCPFRADCVALRRDQVADLPTSRPRKAVPRRRCVALWIDDGRGQWLLERRPPVGIWGGLWSLPQFDSRAEAEGWAAALGRLGEATALAPVEHVFTHFRLTIEPLRLRLLEASARLADNAALDWIDPARLGDYGLPAPIRRLLQAERGAQAGLFGAMPDTATSL